MTGEILLIEDDEDLRTAIRRKLELSGYTVHEAGSCARALREYEKCMAPLILCDINLPDGSGIALCKSIRERSDALFLFLTALDTEEDMIAGYEAGADDYITKPFSQEVLLSKVNAMFARVDRREGAGRLVCDGIVLSPEAKKVWKDGAILSLTAREYTLLEYLMFNPMRILSRDQILNAVWNLAESFVDENTLAVNIRRLREKVETDLTKPVYIKNIRGLGYIWDRKVVRR